MFFVKYYEFCEQDDMTTIIVEDIKEFTYLNEAKQYITTNFSNKFNLDFLKDEFEYRAEEEFYIHICDVFFFYKLVLEKKKN